VKALPPSCDNARSPGPLLGHHVVVQGTSREDVNGSEGVVISFNDKNAR